VDGQGLYWFTEARTFLLLDTYRLFEMTFEGHRQPMTLWGKIAAIMEEKGCKGVSARMCKDKFKNLKTRYKAIIARTHSTGAEGVSKWLFLDAMDDHLRKDVAVNPTNIIEAGASGYNTIKRRCVC
jgi:hypothetical protein